MTQEEKQLLLKDLCARLPYGVKICVNGYTCTLLDINTEMGDKLNGKTFHTLGFNELNGDYNFCTISEVKPYLRPMSSMTEEEFKEWRYLFLPLPHKNEATETERRIDWLNVYHFDYRGLIEKGLALPAPEGMYNVKEK